MGMIANSLAESARAHRVHIRTGTVVERIVLDQEKVRGVVLDDGTECDMDIGTYERFADRAQQVKRDLRRLLSNLLAQGKKVVGYGAPAKANTLLGFLEIGRETLEYIADVSPLKQGRYTPDTHIPVVPPERLLESQPDYVLLLAWNFADEIMEQQAEYSRRGGRFIVPVPEVKIV